MSSRPSMRRVVLLALLVALCLVPSGCGGNKVTKANADKIANGMSEKDVSDLLGAPTESSEVNLPDVGGLPGGDVPGLPKMPKGAKRSSWKDGTKVITVIFLDGKVVEKTVSGL